MVSRLHAKTNQIGKLLNNLEKYNCLTKEGQDGRSPTTPSSIAKTILTPRYSFDSNVTSPIEKRSRPQSRDFESEPLKEKPNTDKDPPVEHKSPVS